MIDGVPKREYLKLFYKYAKVFLEVIKRDTSLKALIAIKFPRFYGLELKEGERLKYRGRSFAAHKNLKFPNFTIEAAHILTGAYSIPEYKVEEGDIVFDIGAHYGYFSLYAANNKAEKVYAFEPNPYAFEILKKHIELWKESIEAYNFAFYSEKCKKKLFIPAGRSGTIATLLSESERENTAIEAWKYEETIEVECRTIDDFVNEKGTEVDFIKIDAEGSEREILLGAKETIKKFKPKIAVSSYHRPDDKEVIPKIVKSIRDDYKFNLQRKHEELLFFF